MITPLHYSLEIDPRLEEETFSGEVAIEVSAAGQHDRIVLDSSGLRISDATIDGRAARVEIAGDRLSVIAAAPIEGSRVVLRIGFQGRMSQTRRGLFRSGASAVTQLQPAYARCVFPCFDNPVYKTTFDVTIAASPSHVVAGNAPLLRDAITGGRRRVTLARSTRIPTYLFGFAVGPFETIALNRDGLEVRFLSLQPDGSELLVLESVHRFIRDFTDRLGVAYPWPKLDLVTIPDFEAAGIETTSVLYFRERALTLASASDDVRRQALALVAHELAHQWFGSLVTPAMWEDLWLSEGFATWLAAKTVANGDGEDTVRAIRAATAADSLPSSRPLRTSGRNPEELHELYDAIAYWKGAAILRTLEAWLGETTFRQGIKLYLTRHAHAHATTDDLWRALEEVARKPVAAVAKPLVERPGVPALRFAWDEQNVHIERDGEDPRTIPIFLKAGLENGGVESRHVLLESRSLEVSMPGRIVWLIGNAGAAGYYRCSYDRMQALPADRLTDAEAVTVLSDAWDALWSGAGDVLDYLRVAEDMRLHPGIATVVSGHLSELSALLAGGPREEFFSRWIATNFKSVVHAPAVSDDMTLAHFEKRLSDARTRPSAWEELKAKWDDVRHQVISFGGRGALTALASVSDRVTRNDIAQFFAARSTGVERTLRQTLETIDGRIRFRQREQWMFDAWLTRQANPAITADESLRRTHALVNVLAAGFHGALVHRGWLAGLHVSPPDWMQPSEDLMRVVAALEGRLTAIVAGKSVIDAPLLALVSRLQEDLLASSDLARDALSADAESSTEAAKMLAAMLARQGAVFERAVRGSIAFTHLFGDNETAHMLRRRLRATEPDRSRMQKLLDRIAMDELTEDVRRELWNACRTLPAMQRSQAADLSSLVSSASATVPPPPTEPGS